MKTTFETVSFKKALATVSPAVARNSTLPILSHVRVQTSSIEGSDLSVQITAPVRSTGDEISICMPTDRLKAAVAVAGEFMVFEWDKGACVIKCGKHRFKVPYLNAQDFPTIDEVAPETTFQSTREMHDAIAGIAFATAINDVRYYLNGVFLECRNGLIEATATNGHFAATTKVTEHATPFSSIVPRSVLEILTKADPGLWSISGSMVILESDSARIVAKCIDGKFPDWRRIMNSGKESMKLSRAELVQAVGLSKLMRDNNKMRPMKVHAKTDVLKITTSQHSETIETELSILELIGGEKEFGVNGDLLEPIIKAHDDESITLNYSSDPNSSIMVENGDFRAVLMPLRV